MVSFDNCRDFPGRGLGGKMGYRMPPTADHQQFIYVSHIASKYKEAREWTEQESAVIARHLEYL